MKALTSFLFFYSANVFAQNLVMNGSFEDYYSCPNSSNQVDSCVNWNNVLNTPDYYASCAAYPVSIPDNFCGSQDAFAGNAYMGLFTYVWWLHWKEIIGAPLVDSLIPGKTYHISMRASRGNWTNDAYNTAASNKLGMRFTTVPYSLSNPPPINNYAQVYENSIILDTLDWVLLQWDYVSDSAYKYVYIGNFFIDGLTDTAVINAPLGQFGQAYYFIDSVNIFCIDEACATAVGSQLNPTLTISPNPASTQINIVYSITQTSTLTITDAYGRVVKQLTLYPYFKNRVVYLEGLAQGVYLVSVEGDGKRWREKLVVQ